MFSHFTHRIFCAFLFLFTATPAIAVSPVVTVEDYFWLVSEPRLKKDQVRFPVKDLKNGYLTVAPPADSDGIQDQEFVLFRGEKERALVVSQSGECGPGCRYRYQGTEFLGKAQRLDGPFSKYYPLATMSSSVRKMWPAKALEGVPKAWPQEEHFRFSLPKAGKLVKAYVLFPATDANGRSEEYFEVGSLEWAKKRFRFRFEKFAKPVGVGQWDLR
jgi:hypothetical protein